MVSAPSRPISTTGGSERRTAPCTNPPTAEATHQAPNTTPVSCSSPASRRLATSATSVPDSTRVAPLAATSTPSSAGVSQLRRGGTSPGSRSSASLRVGGFIAYSASAAATVAAPVPSTATVGDAAVTTSTPTAGPRANDPSTEMESSENAVRRWSSGTSAVRACRATPNTGSANTPLTSAEASSAGYGSSGRLNQNAASAATDS